MWMIISTVKRFVFIKNLLHPFRNPSIVDYSYESFAIDKRTVGLFHVPGDVYSVGVFTLLNFCCEIHRATVTAQFPNRQKWC